MKTESDLIPLHPYELELDGELVNVLFFENILLVEPVPAESGTGVDVPRYQFDMYRIDGLRNRPRLAEIIEDNFDDWLSMAKELEHRKLADAIRTKRNGLLAETDWTQTMDAPLDEDEIESYRIYRQALRDVPGQAGFPYADVEWPRLEREP